MHNHNRDWALRLAEAGIAIFPCGDDKKPLVKWRDFSSCDPKVVAQWWSEHPNALPAIDLAKCDLFVLDGDRHGGPDGRAALRKLLQQQPGFHWHAAPSALTPGDGAHVYFRQNGHELGNARGQLPDGVDARGFGGYVIAPYATLSDGRRYITVTGTPDLISAYSAGTIPHVPQGIVGLLQAKERGRSNQEQTFTNAGAREFAFAHAALEGCMTELASTGAGNRNERLNAIAYRLGRMIARGWINRSDVEGALIGAMHANGAVADDGIEAARATLKSGIAAGMAEPHPDLAERDEPAPASTKAEKTEPRTFDQAPPQRDNTSAQQHDWDDPDWSILDDRRGQLPEFPIHLLNPKAQNLIDRTARGAGVTPAHVAVPFIGILSSLLGTARRVRATSSWLQPMTCWSTVVGYSGTGKTPGLNVTKRCLKQVERDGKNADDAKRRAHETKKESASATRAAWQKAVKDAIEVNRPAPQMPTEAADPGKFVPPKLYVSDGTIEQLGELLQARPQGILFLRDELSGLFTNMSRYSSGQDNEFWLEAWNGNSFNVERMGRTLHVDHLLIGIAGGMQPDKLVKSFEGDHDGMYARVLFSWPTEPACPTLSDDALEIEPDIQNAIGRVNNLAEFTEEGRLVIRDVPLSSEAEDEFSQFAQYVYAQKDAFEGREREWWAKTTAHVLRLSGALAYLPWAIDGGQQPAAVNRDAMASAIEMVRGYFWPHARACLRQIGLTERHANARRVLRWLRTAHKAEVSREEVRRDALSQKLDADGTTVLLSGLCRSGWLKEQIGMSGPHGGKRPRRWSVNPKLFNSAMAETAETS